MEAGVVVVVVVVDDGVLAWIVVGVAVDGHVAVEVEVEIGGVGRGRMID